MRLDDVLTPRRPPAIPLLASNHLPARTIAVKWSKPVADQPPGPGSRVLARCIGRHAGARRACGLRCDQRVPRAALQSGEERMAAVWLESAARPCSGRTRSRTSRQSAGPQRPPARPSPRHRRPQGRATGSRHWSARPPSIFARASSETSWSDRRSTLIRSLGRFSSRITSSSVFSRAKYACSAP